MSFLASSSEKPLIWRRPSRTAWVEQMSPAMPAWVEWRRDDTRADKGPTSSPTKHGLARVWQLMLPKSDKSDFGGRGLSALASQDAKRPRCLGWKGEG